MDHKCNLHVLVTIKSACAPPECLAQMTGRIQHYARENNANFVETRKLGPMMSSKRIADFQDSVKSCILQYQRTNHKTILLIDGSNSTASERMQWVQILNKVNPTTYDVTPLLMPTDHYTANKNLVQRSKMTHAEVVRMRETLGSYVPIGHGELNGGVVTDKVAMEIVNRPGVQGLSFDKDCYDRIERRMSFQNYEQAWSGPRVPWADEGRQHHVPDNWDDEEDEEDETCNSSGGGRCYSTSNPYRFSPNDPPRSKPRGSYSGRPLSMYSPRARYEQAGSHSYGRGGWRDSGPPHSDHFSSRHYQTHAPYDLPDPRSRPAHSIPHHSPGSVSKNPHHWPVMGDTDKLVSYNRSATSSNILKSRLTSAVIDCMK